MVSLTFFGGVGEIGGNKILVETKEAKIFLDFGQSFTMLDEFFLPSQYLSPRERFGLKDYFEFGFVPKLEGLYSKEAIERTNVRYKKPEYDAVFLSHAHIDHWRHCKFLHEDIPIYVGECTKRILRSTWTTSGQSYKFNTKMIRTFRTGKKLKAGDIIIRPIHVDHSVPAAYGFIIETPEGSIVYTGDIRKHGPRADMTEEFLEEAAKAEPEALIIEGTRVVPEEKRKTYSEKEVYKGSLDALMGERPAIVMRYVKDLDRFRTFYNVAIETEKLLVISRKTAHLLTALKGDIVNLPDPVKDDNIRIYDRELMRYQHWEMPFLGKGVAPEKIRLHPEKYITELDFWTLNEMIDLKPVNGVLVHSMSEPFDEDPLSVMSDEVLKNWVKHYEIKHHQLHASGHASKIEIFDMIKQISPKRVFPVHTKHPEVFKESGGNIVLVKKGQKTEMG